MFMIDIEIIKQAEYLGISKAAVSRLPDWPNKTVVAACLSYRDDTPGNIPSYTRVNYYRVLSKMLHKLGKFIKHAAGDTRSDGDVFRTSVNGVLNDKIIAAAAGLGGFADNHLIAVDGVGSMTVLGTLIIDEECEITKPLSQLCDEQSPLCNHCGVCFASCPTGALTPNGVDKSKCLQHNSSVMDFNTDLIPLWGTRFFGCSICTDCCPINETAQLCPKNSAELTGYIGATFDIENIFRYRKGDYKAHFRANQLAATWMEEIIHPRNILTSLHNAGRDEDVQRYASDIDRYGWDENEKEYLLRWCDILLNHKY